ncbi:MAG: hypothetical protein AAFX55_13190 [Bacteroidota bacterium]
MTLLFIENRYKTYFFEPIAQQLKFEGHDIHWLIQNKQFLPSKEFNNYIVDYPKSNLNYEEIDYVEKVIFSDRQINHFNKKDKSYFYYYNTKIEELIKIIEPDVVFGESTAFHELLTIENCKRLNILYLNPSTCRYPVGRFSFYKYDTLEPYSGSGEELGDEMAKEIINQIVNRKAIPNYMAPIKTSRAAIIKDKIKKTLAYCRGETYNTPNPLIKYRLEKKKKDNIVRWNKSALQVVEEAEAFKILYPLQMQPEANIDVWGRPYRNQTQLIEDISKALPPNTLLYVKPNPKSKYELGQDLIHFIENNSNIRALHHTTKMDEVLPLVDLVITVTGTIAIECILSNKPVATLVETINNRARNCRFIHDIMLDIPKIVSIISENEFPRLTDEEKVEYINLLNRTSFKGLVSDPLSDINCISEENITNLVLAFSEVFKKLKTESKF